MVINSPPPRRRRRRRSRFAVVLLAAVAFSGLGAVTSAGTTASTNVMSADNQNDNDVVNLLDDYDNHNNHLGQELQNQQDHHKQELQLILQKQHNESVNRILKTNRNQDIIINNNNDNNDDDADSITASAVRIMTREQFEEEREQRRRELQLCDGVCDRYQIGESEILYAGTEVRMTFPVNDLVPDNTVDVMTFSDQDCSVDITGNDYLVPAVNYDDNPNPTGDKDREIKVVYTFDPAKITDTDVWVERDGGQTVFLSFCMAVNLLDGPVDVEGSKSMARLDTLVFIKVEFEGDFGVGVEVEPGDRLEEGAQEIYRVDGYWCDTNNTRIEELVPLIQGQPVRVCVEPRLRAREDGIFMRRVDSFTYYRIKDDGSEINQETLRDGGAVDESITILDCRSGYELCWFETILNGEFFFKPGLVIGYGEAWLQFGRSEILRKRKLVVDMSSYPPNVDHGLTVSDQREMKRSLQVVGGFANSDAIGVEIFVIPEGENLYEAVAFHCDSKNRPIEIDPVFNGESVRICVTPNEEAQAAGVVIQSLETWNFTRNLIMQQAIEDNGPAELGGSVIGPCGPRSRICAFHTILEPDFFPSVGIADGVGMVNLVFGGYVPGRLDISRRRLHRNLQVDQIEEIEMAGISAGRSEVGLPTPLAYVQPEEDDSCYYEHEFHEWWLEEPMSKRIEIIGIIGGIIGAIAASFCCLWLFPPFCWMGRDEEEEVLKGGGADVQVNVDMNRNTTTETTTNNTTSSSARQLQTQEDILQPRRSDIVFGDSNWPGTLEFFEIVCRVAESHPEDEYHPAIYREIKRAFSDQEFYSKDIENRVVKKPTKQEIIAFVGKMYSEARILLRDNPDAARGSLQRRSSRRSMRDLEDDDGFQRSSSLKSLRGRGDGNGLKRSSSKRSMKGLGDGDELERSSSLKSLQNLADGNRLKRSSSKRSMKDLGDGDELKRSSSFKSLRSRGDDGGGDGQSRRGSLGSRKSFRDLIEDDGFDGSRRSLSRRSSRKSLRDHGDDDGADNSRGSLSRRSSRKSLRDLVVDDGVDDSRRRSRSRHGRSLTRRSSHKSLRDLVIHDSTDGNSRQSLSRRSSRKSLKELDYDDGTDGSSRRSLSRRSSRKSLKELDYDDGTNGNSQRSLSRRSSRKSLKELDYDDGTDGNSRRSLSRRSSRKSLKELDYDDGTNGNSQRSLSRRSSRKSLKELDYDDGPDGSSRRSLSRRSSSKSLKELGFDDNGPDDSRRRPKLGRSLSRRSSRKSLTDLGDKTDGDRRRSLSRSPRKASRRSVQDLCRSSSLRELEAAW